jgi:glycine oxidase
MRAVIVGGGIMGCASAYALAKAGASVVVLERAVPGAEASSAAAGILGAQIEAGHDAAFRKRLVAARERYAAWARELEEASGARTGWRKTGAVELAFDDADAARLRAHQRDQNALGLRAEWLDSATLAEIEPEASRQAIGAVHLPDDAQVDPPELLRALVIACARAGVETVSGTTVRELVRDGDRVTGVLTDAGRVSGDAVVLAAGSWSSLVPGWPASLPAVRPVRGQMMLLEERPPRVRSILAGKDGYVVPRGDGRVVCGSTMEEVGHKREVTAGGVRHILERVLALAPRLAEAEMIRAWCNFRPFAGDATPLVGASGVRGLVLATGHHRNGILLAQETSELVRDAVLGARA